MLPLLLSASIVVTPTPYLVGAADDAVGLVVALSWIDGGGGMGSGWEVVGVEPGKRDCC